MRTEKKKIFQQNLTTESFSRILQQNLTTEIYRSSPFWNDTVTEKKALSD